MVRQKAHTFRVASSNLAIAIIRNTVMLKLRIGSTQLYTRTTTKDGKRLQEVAEGVLMDVRLCNDKSRFVKILQTEKDGIIRIFIPKGVAICVE